MSVQNRFLTTSIALFAVFCPPVLTAQTITSAASVTPDAKVSNKTVTLSSLNPTSTMAGSSDLTLTVLGSNFNTFKSPTVVFESTGPSAERTELAPFSNNAKGITVNIPSALLTIGTTAYISLYDAKTRASSINQIVFTVNNPDPLIISTLPTSMTVSTQDAVITIKGGGFIEGMSFQIRNGTGTQNLTPSSVQPDSATITIPSALVDHPGTLFLTAINSDPCVSGAGQCVSNELGFIVHGLSNKPWHTVANNFSIIPNSPGRTFNSFNQPSINSSGLAVFKGQSKGESGPALGIFARDISQGNTSQIVPIADNLMPVPQPNNTSYNGALATFIQFPSFPRIDINSNTMVLRGQSQPVYTYTLPGGSETRLGSTGIYLNQPDGTPVESVPYGSLVTGASLLGVAPGYGYFSVPDPDAPSGTRFDQFPGSPAVTSGSNIVFKGNYTVGDIGQTGVFFRNLKEGEQAPIYIIDKSGTLIPGQAEGGTAVFGSTAPPSAAYSLTQSKDLAVFVGLDNEDAPTMGGIYSAPLQNAPSLTTLVRIGDQVPGEANGVVFNRLGEGLSFDGRYLAFWGAWGSETREQMLVCGSDGNKDMIASCNEQYPNGYVAQIPVHQGIFVYDLEATSNPIIPLAKTPGEFNDFVYWVFSGRPPNTGGESDGGDVPEPPRWRSSAFLAVQGADQKFLVAFKASTGVTDAIYLGHGPESTALLTVLETAMPGSFIDPQQAPFEPSVVTVGVERDGLRGNRLVVSSSLLNSETSVSGAGIYVTDVE